MYSVLIDDRRELLTPSATQLALAASSTGVGMQQKLTLAVWMQRRRMSSTRPTDSLILDGPFAETKG